MNKNVITWIEGDGTVRTVFRKMALCEYITLERTKVQLLKAIGKGEDQTSPYLLRYAVDKRKMEIQWISLYLPILVMSMPVLFASKALLLSHLALHLYVWIGLVLTMSLVFRMTFFSMYQETCRFIYLAADSLLKGAEKKVEVTEACAEIALTDSTNFSPINSAAGEKQQDLAVLLPPEPEATVSLEAPETAAGKGSITIVLLHELIQKECGRPNIYKGNTQNALAYYVHVTGCQPKNLQGKVKNYKSREAINLSTPNIRATHKKYLDILLSYYEEIGDDALYNKAEDLQAFIENSKNWKKS